LGGEVLQAIRADKRLTETRVIIVTADVSLGVELQNEADFVLFKPVSTIQLREVATKLRTKRPKK
jgi:CheY-like chemotaxis protein